MVRVKLWSGTVMVRVKDIAYIYLEGSGQFLDTRLYYRVRLKRYGYVIGLGLGERYGYVIGSYYRVRVML